MSARILGCAVLGFIAAIGFVASALGQSAIQCGSADSTNAITLSQDLFYPVRPGGIGTLSRRDLEFQWDAQFDPVGGPVRQYDLLTLDRLGITLAELPNNPFNANLSDLHLTWEYFRAYCSPSYDPDPLALYGFIAGEPVQVQAPPCEPDTCSNYRPTPLRERGHVDHYLYRSGHGFTYARWPSEFYTAKEDSSTGWWQSDASWTVWPTNALMSPLTENPPAIDRLGTGWAGPNRVTNLFFMHEFQHSMPKGGVLPSSLMDEVFSTGIEPVTGSSEVNYFEVPYTKPLLSVGNYQNWPLFAGYLAYNYRGLDTSPTIAGFADDLLARWARGDRTLLALRDQLSNINCPECATKPWFLDSLGGPLPLSERFDILFHNWRVANYVNNTTLHDGQYGYPPQFNFSPTTNYRAWQSTDPGANDAEAIPPEVVARTTWTVRETTVVGTRFPSAAERYGPVFAPMSVFFTGSELWVVRSDPGLAVVPYELVVRVLPEGVLRTGGCTPV